MEQISAADYVLAGETHDEPCHHAAQARIVAALGSRQTVGYVYFEMLEPGHDAAVAEYLAGRASLADLQRATAWNDRGWPIWDGYAPIFEAARQGAMRVSHGNPERDLIRNINQQGLAALPRQMRQELRIRPEGPFAVNFEALKAEIGRHHPLPPDVTARFAASQYVKDAHMAFRLASRDSGILIAGNGHVRADLGVPAHLRLYRPGKRLLSIGMIAEPAGGAEAARDAAWQDGRKLYDLVWFSGAPCKAS